MHYIGLLMFETLTYVTGSGKGSLKSQMIKQQKLA